METSVATEEVQPCPDGDCNVSQAMQPPSTEMWPASYEAPPEAMFDQSGSSATTMAKEDVEGSCPDTFMPQCQSVISQDVGQPMPSSGNFCRPTPGCPPTGDQQQQPLQARRFYTGDISDAYDETCNFWNFLDQELEPKQDIKVEPRSPCWPEADSTSCSPYGSAGSYCPPAASLEHLQSFRYDEPRAPANADSVTMTSCCYYELQPPQLPPPPPPQTNTHRDPLMGSSPTNWPMDLSVRLGATDPYYHCQYPPPQRLQSADVDWNQQPQQQHQCVDNGAARVPSMSRRTSFSAFDDGLKSTAGGFYSNQAWHGQGTVSPVSSDAPEVPLSPTGAFLKRFPYVGPRDDPMATSLPPAPPPTPLPALPPNTSPHLASGSQVPDGSRIYYRNGSPTEGCSQASNGAQSRAYQGPPSPPATMTTLLSAVQQKQQQVSASVAAYHQRPRSMYERSFVQVQKSTRVRPAALTTHTLVTLSPRSSAGTPTATGYAPRFAGTPTYYNAFKPLPTVNQVSPRPGTITVSTASHPSSSPHQEQQQAVQATGEGRQQPQLHQQQFRFPKSHLTLLLTPTVRHGTLPAAPGINLSAAAPASILIHSQPAGQFRYPLAAAAGLAQVGRFQTTQASTSTSAVPDSATKPRKTAAERSHPAVNYALRSLKIGPFLLQADDPDTNLGYKFKIIFSKRRFMYEFESLPSSEDGGMRLSCVIVPFQSLQSLRCEEDYILVQVHSRPVMFLGRRTTPSNKKGSGASATGTSSLSDHLELYPVHKIQLNTTDVVRIRHLLWEFNPRFHELMLRRISDVDTKLDEPLPPYGAPGRAAWRHEVAKANKTAKKTPVGRRRGMVARNRAVVAAAGHPGATAAARLAGASSLVPFSVSSTESGAPSSSSTCACRVSCRVARCSCAKARTRCDPARCACLACDNPLNLLEAVGIPLRDAQADPCLMQAVFQVSDLPWYLCQQVRLNCCPESVMVRECIPGPMPCPRCGHAAQYSWCANTLFHGSTNHCAVCVRCNLFAGEHCQVCNCCYYYSGNNKNCPRCRRAEGMQIVQRQASETAAAATVNTVQVLTIQTFAGNQQKTQAEQSRSPTVLPAIEAPPPQTPVLDAAQAPESTGLVMDEPQDSNTDPELMVQEVVPAVSDANGGADEPVVTDVIQAEDKAEVICVKSEPDDRDGAPPLVVDV